ncbi:MAG: tetratricopeptide repeat protein, partial [Methanotrichaceae archaeon]|nr:tetratricopeptide repeat protein [Methanotrichaceae archaeon]
MSKLGLLLLSMLSVIMSTGLAVDIPFIFDERTSGASELTATQLESMRAESAGLAGVPAISILTDDHLMDMPVTGGGSAPAGTNERKVGDLKNALNLRVEPANPSVHTSALTLAAKHHGDYTIQQVSTIYSYLKENWHYGRDPRGIDYFNYANESLKVGKDAGCFGAGDCDDFAILMSALIESIGGTTRIIFAQNNSTGGHAYTEVYLGRLNATNSQVENVIKWLKQKFNAQNINTHIDTESKEVWLNLDWGTDKKGNAYPGGPFFKGNRHILINIRDEFEKTPLLPPEDFVKNEPSFEATTASKPLAAVSPQQTAKDASPKTASYLGGGDANTLIDLGIVQNNERNFQAAIGLYDQALEQDPGNYLAWELKGFALHDLGRYEEALSSFDRAIAIDSGRDHAWRDKGETLYIMGRYQEAVECFDRAIQIRPCADYWRQKGEALMGFGRDAEAS